MSAFGPRAPMQSVAGLAAELLLILGDYVSPINARSLLARSSSSGSGGSHLDLDNLEGVLRRVESGAMLFTTPARRTELQSRLDAFRRKHIDPSASIEHISIRSEDDIVVARTRARSLCGVLGAGSVAAHKVATVVSELARNIVSYTPGGSIELMPHAAKTSVTVRAKDTGAGIPNLDNILGGSYRSRTGLGLGLIGSRKLAQDFDIKTGPAGTTVVVVLAL